MSNRQSGLNRIKKTVEENASTYFPYAHSARRVMEKIDAFNDDTIEMMAEAFRSKPVHPAILERTMLLLSTGQIKNLEPTIRNIIIFAEAEAPYKKSLDMRSSTFKKLHPVERYARKYVCGAPNALETPEQVPLMIAAMHAIFGMLTCYISVNNLDAYLLTDTTRGFVKRLDKGNLDTPKYYENWQMQDLHGAYELIDFFIAHPEQAERLSVFVAQRGIVDADVLESSLTTTSAIAIGLL